MFEKQKTKFSFGFTLAEVLITLGIIGVVAAMTIPTLMNSTKEKELRVAWKKSYSAISQVVGVVLNEEGGNFKYMFDEGANTDNTASEKFKDTFKTHFSYTKDCKGTAAYGGSGSGGTSEGCWHKANEWTYLYGAARAASDNPGLILNDGTFVRFGMDKSDCSHNAVGASLTRCGFIQVDVNGLKKPNIQGKDIFAVDIAENFVYPEGSHDWFPPETTCVDGSTANTNTGHGCSAKYLLN